MYRSILIQVVGFLGAFASIITLIGSHYPNLLPFSWLNSSLTVPMYAVSILLGLMSILVLVSGRLLYFHIYHHTIPADARSVMEYMLRNKLLNDITNLDICHYTAETITTPWREDLEEHQESLNIRLMVRRPETDPNKHRVAEGCLDTVREIAKRNSNLNIDVRFYNDNPLLRCQMFYNENIATCIAGIYRHDPKHPMRFVGAEKNVMLVLKKNRRREKAVIEAIKSRFDYFWGYLSPLRAVIFDMDGVLINSMGYHFQAWKEACIYAGIQIRESELRKEVYQLEGKKGESTAIEFYKKYADTTPDEEMVKDVVKKKHEVFLELSSEIKPFEGVHEVLDYLRSRGVPLAVVTGTVREAVDKTINNIFPNVFSVVVSGSDVERGKPDPLPFITAAEKLRIGNSDQCLVIENSPLGVQAANSAGIPVYCLLIDSPLDPRDLEQHGAIHVYASHFRLLEKLKSMTFNDLIMAQNNIVKGTAAKMKKGGRL